MKRQLVAALLALNVAAVAVPSATFTVSAADAEPVVETQATEEVEIDAQATTQPEIDLSEYREEKLSEVESYDGPTGTTYTFTGAASTRRSAINSETDTKLHKSNDKAEMRKIASDAKTEIDQLANEVDKSLFFLHFVICRNPSLPYFNCYTKEDILSKVYIKFV